MFITNYFIDVPAYAGCVVGVHHYEEGYAIVRPGEHLGKVLGILLHNVVSLEYDKLLVSNTDVRIGDRVSVTILNSGSNLRVCIPYARVGDPIYYSKKDGHLKLTGKKKRYVGRCLREADKEGWCIITLC